MRHDPSILKMARHADGTGTRLHTCLVTRGTPRRLRRTWIVGYSVTAEGIAVGGGNCHGTLDSALAAYDREIERKGGATVEALPGYEV